MSEAEVFVRLSFQATKKLDVVRSLPLARFVAALFCNYTRVAAFSSLLVDEGLLPLLITMMESHTVDEVMAPSTEALANLSINRKNRREIAASGIALRLPTLFDRGSPSVRAFSLLIMGNLLSSTSTFHDKVATDEIVANILDNLLDIRHAKQFNAVAYCLYQLSLLEASCEVQ